MIRAGSASVARVLVSVRNRGKPGISGLVMGWDGMGVAVECQAWGGTVLFFPHKQTELGETPRSHECGLETSRSSVGRECCCYCNAGLILGERTQE